MYSHSFTDPLTGQAYSVRRSEANLETDAHTPVLCEEILRLVGENESLRLHNKEVVADLVRANQHAQDLEAIIRCKDLALGSRGELIAGQAVRLAHLEGSIESQRESHARAAESLKARADAFQRALKAAEAQVNRLEQRVGELLSGEDALNPDARFLAYREAAGWALVARRWKLERNQAQRDLRSAESNLAERESKFIAQAETIERLTKLLAERENALTLAKARAEHLSTPGARLGEILVSIPLSKAAPRVESHAAKPTWTKADHDAIRDRVDRLETHLDLLESWASEHDDWHRDPCDRRMPVFPKGKE